MATKSDRPGLLSKMALFVRNPTKDWSDLDRPEPMAESGYDKHALKAMIERKRQNDFVRKREFDQLRKLRSREVGAMGGVARPSIFQTSMATDPDGRAVTLKKIDEIEAQMSKQWWKGKHDAAQADDAGLQAAADRAETPQALAPTVPSKAFETTQSEALQPNASEFVETEMGSGMAPRPSQPALSARRGPELPTLPGLSGHFDQADEGFSTSKLFAIDVGDMPTDPELEEASIRFANGDDTGAESGLLQALRAGGVGPEIARSWAAALLDFYRATKHREKFDTAVIEFSGCWGNAAPAWSRVLGGLAAAAPAAPLAPSFHEANQGVTEDAIWECPADLTVQAMEQLRESMGSQPMPWLLGWSRLNRISADAMPFMAGLFGSLCDEPVALRFSGSDQLERILRGMMPSGDRSVDPAWWTVRLNALRTMQMQDEFELGALDYCVTYEVSPPSWSPARCQFERVDLARVDSSGRNSGLGGGGASHAPTEPMALGAAPAFSLSLRGEVLGDATQALTLGDSERRGADSIVVSCEELVRVDFSAAGSILNWVALRQAEGCQVQFRDVHRLVAAFFNVIGINEHARVLPRPI